MTDLTELAEIALAVAVAFKLGEPAGLGWQDKARLAKGKP